jgi:hypothetical protein
MLIVGGLGVAFNQPWLFPSLAPTAYLQGETPKQPSAKIYHVIVGHIVGLAMGFVAVALVNAWSQPVVLTTGILTVTRVAAAAIAMGLTTLINLLLHASHPPAGATTLLVALGAFNTLPEAINVIIGVIIIGVAGEGFRQVRARK